MHYDNWQKPNHTMFNKKKNNNTDKIFVIFILFIFTKFFSNKNHLNVPDDLLFKKSLQTNNMSESSIHEALKPISWLAGRWITTEGKGVYPNLNDFKYHEELEFNCIGQPMFNFMSKSSHPEKGTPMHQERGFLHIKPGTNDLAFVVSHNFGLTSLEEGQCNPEKKEIKLSTVNVSRISFAKEPHVKAFKREIRLLDTNTLEITLFMETDNTPLSEHLKAVYKKV